MVGTLVRVIRSGPPAREAGRRTTNESAADALQEAVDEVWTLPRLQVPARLRKTRMSTNPSARLCALVRPVCVPRTGRHRERTSTRTRLPRWRGTVWRYCEQPFKHVNGLAGRAPVLATLEAEHTEPPPGQTKKAA